MLCSLLILGKNIEGMLYEAINKKMKEKQKQYSRLPLKSIEQIFAAIETNIEDIYIYK